MTHKKRKEKGEEVEQVKRGEGENPGLSWWLLLGGVVVFAVLSLLGAVVLVLLLSLG